MPVFKDPRTIKKVELPSVKGSEVEIWNTLLWGDMEKIYTLDISDIARVRKALVCLIKDWNLTDEKGEKLPITEATLEKFSIDDIFHLVSQTDFKSGELREFKKKEATGK